MEIFRDVFSFFYKFLICAVNRLNKAILMSTHNMHFRDK